MSDIPLPPPFGLSNIVLAAAESHKQDTQFDKLFIEFLKDYSEDLSVMPSVMDLAKSNKSLVVLCNYILSENIQYPEYESHGIPENDSMGREKFWEDMGRP